MCYKCNFCVLNYLYNQQIYVKRKEDKMVIIESKKVVSTIYLLTSKLRHVAVRLRRK